jgi:hypothetical protein
LDLGHGHLDRVAERPSGRVPPLPSLQPSSSTATRSARWSARPAGIDNDHTQGRAASLSASLSYGLRNAFTDAEQAELAVLHLFHDTVDVGALALWAPTAPGATRSGAGRPHLLRARHRPAQPPRPRLLHHPPRPAAAEVEPVTVDYFLEFPSGDGMALLDGQ